MAGKKIESKRPRRARAKALSLKARKHLLETLIYGALEDLPDKDIEAVSELLTNIAINVLTDGLGVAEGGIAVLHPTHPTARLLNAINDHIEATDEPGDKIVERLIASLGSQAAYASQPN